MASNASEIAVATRCLTKSYGDETVVSNLDMTSPPSSP